VPDHTPARHVVTNCRLASVLAGQTAESALRNPTNWSRTAAERGFAVGIPATAIEASQLTYNRPECKRDNGFSPMLVFVWYLTG